MKKLIGWLAGEPVLAPKIIGAIISLLTVFGLDLDGEAKGALATLVLAGLAFYAVVVRSATVSPSTLVTKVEEAATKTAEQVTDTTAGAVGTVTEGAHGVVKGVVGEVVEGVGGIAGGLAGAVTGAVKRQRVNP